MNKTITKMKNTLDEINSRLNKNGSINYKTWEWKSLPPNRKKEKGPFKRPLDNIRGTNIYIIGIPESKEEKRENRGLRKYLKR